MKRKFVTGLLLLALCSCKEDSKVIDEIKNSVSESISEAQKIDFNKTKFKDRAEELTCIREYLKQELPDKLLREQPKQLQDAQYFFISIGKDYTLRETAIKVLDTIKATQTIMHTVVKQDLSLSATKKLIKNTDLSSPAYRTTFSNDSANFSVNTQYINEVEELTKIYPNKKSNFTHYHSENFISKDKPVKLTYKVEHLPITEMEASENPNPSPEEEYQDGSIDGTIVISRNKYYVKGGYVGEGNFEGVAYDLNGDIFGILSWSYGTGNHLSMRVTTQKNSTDYDLILMSKSK